MWQRCDKNVTTSDKDVTTRNDKDVTTRNDKDVTTRNKMWQLLTGCDMFFFEMGTYSLNEWKFEKKNW